MNKVIEVNNGRKIELEFAEDGIGVKTINDCGELEREEHIDDGEFVMLLNLYQALWQSGRKSAYILDDFAWKILEQSNAMDVVEEFQILN